MVDASVRVDGYLENASLAPPLRAQNLPFHILVSIFKHLLEGIRHDESAPDTLPEATHGGQIIRWNTNEHISRVVRRVCWGWEDAAVFWQYRSIAVIGARSGTAFLAAVSGRLELGPKIVSLVVSLGSRELAKLADDELVREAEILVRVVQSCPRLQQLQVRPLPASTRSSLVSTLSALHLTTLVLTPRYDRTACTWTKGLLRSSDLYEIITPSILDLELNIDLEDTSFELASLLSFPPLSVRRARIHVDLPRRMLRDFLFAASSSLTSLGFYSESATYDLHPMFKPVFPTLRHLSFIVNPPFLPRHRQLGLSPPDNFDDLLPLFQSLESLSLTSSDLSIQAMRALPQTLRELEVWSLRDEPRFAFSQELVDIVDDPRTEIGLKSLTVRDIRAMWRDEDVEALTAALERRGCCFTFLPDAEGGA